MAKKKFDIETYSKSKILSPKKYKVWLSQIQEKGNDEKELQQLNDRLRTDIEASKSTRKKLFSKWWLKELASAAAIVGGAVLVNFFTPFSPFSFLLAGAALLTAINVVVFGIIPGIRFLTNKYKRLNNFKNQLDNQKQLDDVKSKEMINELSKKNELSKNFVSQEVLAEEKTFEPSPNVTPKQEKKSSLFDNLFKPQTNNDQQGNLFHAPSPAAAYAVIDADEDAKKNSVVENKHEEAVQSDAEVSKNETSSVITPVVVKTEEKAVEEEKTPLAVKELHFDNNEQKHRYIFRVKTRTMTADGTCPNEDVFVNISTTNLDKFIEELSKKNFLEKGLKVSRSQRAKKANAVVLTVENARQLIDSKLQNGEITPKQAEKLKKQITSVVLVLEISHMKNPTKKTFESREYTIDQKDDFFKIVEKVKLNVLKQAQEIKASEEQENEQVF